MKKRIPEDPLPIVLGAVVARGTFYNFYEIEGIHHRWAKKTVPSRVKQYSFGMRITYPMWLYTRFKYGVSDLIVHETQVAQKLPDEIQPYLLQNMTLGKTSEGASVLCADKVFDYDGTLSRTVNNTGRISNGLFWLHVQAICDVLERHRICLLGVFHGGNHVLVHRSSEDEWSPVLVDVAKSGRTMYPFQINLRRASSMWGKFYRQLNRFRNRFMVIPNS